MQFRTSQANQPMNQAVPTTIMSVGSSNFTPNNGSNMYLNQQLPNTHNHHDNHTAKQRIGGEGAILSDSISAQGYANLTAAFYPQQNRQNNSSYDNTNNGHINRGPYTTATSSVPTFAQIHQNSNRRQQQQFSSAVNQHHQSSAAQDSFQGLRSTAEMNVGEHRIKQITQQSYNTANANDGNLFEHQLSTTNGGVLPLTSTQGPNRGNMAGDLRQTSLYLNAHQKQSATKLGITPATDRATENNFFNQIEYASMNGTNRKRKRPVNQRKVVGYQTSENGSRLSNEIDEENSRKTDSGSSCAEEKQSFNSGMYGQNFSYQNFYSFGGNSPQQCENLQPPKLQQTHSQSSTFSSHNTPLTPFDQHHHVYPIQEQKSEWIQQAYNPISSHSNQQYQKSRGLNLKTSGKQNQGQNSWQSQSSNGGSSGNQIFQNSSGQSQRFNCENKISSYQQQYHQGSRHQENDFKLKQQSGNSTNYQQQSTRTAQQYKKKPLQQPQGPTKVVERQPLTEQSLCKPLISSENSNKAKDVQVATSSNISSDKVSSKSSSQPVQQTPQPVIRRLKYEMCKNFREKGNCKYGDKCLFAHGEAELTKRSSAAGPEPVKPAQPTALPKTAAEASIEASTDTKKAAALEAVDPSEKLTPFATPVKEGISAIDADLRSTQESTCGKSQPLIQILDKNATNANTGNAENERKSSSSISRPEQSLIAGDLNYLLDKEIQKTTFVPKAVVVQGCNSTHHSSTTKSPLAAYAVSHSSDFQGGVSPSKQGSTISQRSSFDDSLNNMFTNEINLNSNNDMIRAEISPGKIGDGLFAQHTSNFQNIEEKSVQDGLSSEEEDLIAQSTFEIRNIVASKARPAFMSRFAEMMNADSDHLNDSESQNNVNIEDSFSSQEGGFQQARRLRVFHNITQRSAGKSNEPQNLKPILEALQHE